MIIYNISKPPYRSAEIRRSLQSRIIRRLDGKRLARETDRIESIVIVAILSAAITFAWAMMT